MANNQSVLEQMLEAALSGGALRQGQAAPARSAPGGNLGDILGGLLGGGQMAAGDGGAAGRSAPGGAGGLGEILGSILGGGQMTAGEADPGMRPGTRGGERPPAGPQSSPASQQQAEMAQGTGMSDLVRYGGMAVIGVLAYQALKKYQAQKGTGETGEVAAMVPPADSGFHPARTPGGPDALSGVFVKAMVAAAQADGIIDEDEQRRLAGRLNQLGLSSVDRQALIERLTTPVDTREIVDAATSPELGLQIYAASVLAVTADTPAEKSYLDRLAGALNIEPGLKAQVERTLQRG